MIISWFLQQIQNNWTYGEVLDENAKTHPMLRPYKTFSEKVIIDCVCFESEYKHVALPVFLYEPM